MSLALNNWISGNLRVKITKLAQPQSTYILRTVQLIDPNIDPNIVQIDSVTKHRLGWHDKPDIYQLTLGVVGSEDTGDEVLPAGYKSDLQILSELHRHFIIHDQTSPLDGFFNIEIWDIANQIGTFRYEYCVITSSNPSNITIDQVPVSTWNILALRVKYTSVGDVVVV